MLLPTVGPLAFIDELGNAHETSSGCFTHGAQAMWHGKLFTSYAQRIGK
jgi:hypothetical protein